MPTLIDELSRIIDAFDEKGVAYAVCGGLALAIHGFVRATVDIDLLILPESLEQSYQIGIENDFDIRGLDISFKERAVEIRRVSKIDADGEILSLDFLLVTPAIEKVWETRESIDFRGRKMWVVSREGLMIMKSLAGRPQDLADLDRLQNEES